MRSNNNTETLNVLAALTLMTIYCIIYFIILMSGGIHSVLIIFLYLPLFISFSTGSKIGSWLILINVWMILLLNSYTMDVSDENLTTYLLSNKDYAVLFHLLLTLSMGFLPPLLQRLRRLLKRPERKEELTEVILLNRIITERTQELHHIKENFASYFHDETGNILAAISQQASVLKMKLENEQQLLPIIESISTNCEQLYSSSKDFLWIVNNNSNNPMELFSHLTAFGQRFFNQFEIAFSVKPLKRSYFYLPQMTQFAAKDLIFIFKEGMSNTAKLSNAKNVVLAMNMSNGFVKISLHDNGNRVAAGTDLNQSDFKSIEQRSRKANFQLTVTSDTTGTYMEVKVPVFTTIPVCRLFDSIQ